jgi:predicted phosphodiesterase
MTSIRSTISLARAAVLFATIVLVSACAPAPGSAPNGSATTPAESTARDRSLATTTASAESSAPALPPAQPITFAIIGDFGVDNSAERAVADLVASWSPDFVVTTGDNYYTKVNASGARAYDKTVKKYYGQWLGGAFFPALGNHDYDLEPAPRVYTDYFNLPGPGLSSTSHNERYYDFVKGPIHFFVLNSVADEPDGTTSSSRQARWLKKQLAASEARWNIVVDHHPPYSSDSEHGPSTYMRWPFESWGADAVISGHTHSYERIKRDGIVYFVNGLGGVARYGFGPAVTGSDSRYNSSWGAQKVTVTDQAMTFEFRNVKGELVDRYLIPAK